MLDHYGYRGCDELSLEIEESVQRGYFLDAEIAAKIRNFDDDVRIGKRDRSLSEAWSLYRNNFDANGDAVVPALYEAARDHIAHIDPAHLSPVTCLLRALWEDGKADELLELVISSRWDDVEYFNIDACRFRDFVHDNQMIQRFSEIYRRSPCAGSGERARSTGCA